MSEVRSVRIEVETKLPASRQRVFSALTTGVAVWWGPPCLEDERASDLVLEPRLGGRLYEKWGIALEEKDLHGAILGIVMAIESPEYLRLEGPFGVRTGAVHGVVSIRLEQETDHLTKLKLCHEMIGVIDLETETRFSNGWRSLFERLGHYVEKGHGHGLRPHFHGV